VKRGKVATGKLNSARIAAGLLAVMVAIAIGTAQTRKKKPAGPPPDLPGHIAYLAKQLYGLDIDDAKPITDQIQKLVISHMNAWMADRTPNIVEVRHELDRVFSKLQYPAVAISASFSSPWKNAELIGAGYTLGWSDIWRVNTLVIYENRNGRSREVATTNFVPRTDQHYAVMPPSAAGDFRFLVYGFELGKSHPRLTAVLYSFDGTKLEQQWKTEGLFDGKITVNGDMIVIRYLNEDEFIRATQQRHLPPRHEKSYRVTPQGIQLESEHDIPYQ
jgi:hypothetical protein